MIGCYVRISTASQNTDSQEKELMDYAIRLNEGMPTCYKDVISGKTRNRPGLDQLLKDCRTGKITKILCYKIDRLGRSLINLKELLAEFETMNIPVIFTSQGFSTENSNPASKLFLSMLGAFAEFEREIITERVRAGIAARMDKGLPMGRESISDELKNKIHFLRQNGGSMRKIADNLKLSVGTVHKTLKEKSYD